jgi:hypothetical protein
MTDNMSESCQSLIICLYHTNDWWYVWIIPMNDNMSESCQWLISISDWYDSDISSVIGMIQTYHQSLVWFRHIISHWYDSDILSDNMSESYQWLMICLNHTNYWWYVWIISMTDNMSESYQWLIICLNHTNDWWYTISDWVWLRHITNHWYDSDMLSVIGMIQTYYQWLVRFRYIISDWYDSDRLSVIGMIQTY